MKKYDEIKILNNLLDKIGVKGFSFIYEDCYLSIRIQKGNETIGYYDFDYCLVGAWNDVDDLFKCVTDSHNLSGYSVEYIIQNVIKTHNANNNLGYIANYLNINDIGLDFLKCLRGCDSLKKLKLKLQLNGYKI